MEKSVWKQTEAKAKLIISTLLGDFADCRTEGASVAFTDTIIKTLADNNIVLVNAEMYDEMADLCGAAMDVLEDDYVDE